MTGEPTFASDLSETAEAFLSSRFKVEGPEPALAWDREEFRTFWGELVELGWPGLLVPEELGGLGCGAAEVVALFRSVGRQLAPAPLVDAVVAAPLLVGASPALQALDGVAEGDRLAVWADPTLRGDQRANVRLDGDQLRGHVPIVEHADVADVLILTASDDDGPVVAVVDLGGPEITTGALPSVDACSRPARVDLDGAPASVALRGRDAAAWTDRAVAFGRIAVAAETTGVAQTSTDMAVEYAKSRKQFDRPIGSFQALQHLLADMWVDTYALDSLCELAATAGTDRTDALAKSAKALAADVGLRTVEAALQVHGAIGYTAELPFNLFYKRAVTLAGVLGERRQLYRELGGIGLTADGA